MIFVQLFVLFLGYCFTYQYGYGGYNLRVFHGVADTDNKYPYVVALQYNGMSMCSGTLLSPNWVLTAAHCISDSAVENIRYGDMSVQEEEKKSRSKILKIVPYPGYAEITDLVTSNDIALLKVETVALRAYGNLSALDYKSLLGLPVEYGGFGFTFHMPFIKRNVQNHYDEEQPLLLGEGVVTRCHTAIVSDYFCVSPKCSNKKQQILGGDSGGPLFYAEKIVGVACYMQPDVVLSGYTPVSPYVEWISDVITSQ